LLVEWLYGVCQLTFLIMLSFSLFASPICMEMNANKWHVTLAHVSQDGLNKLAYESLLGTFT